MPVGFEGILHNSRREMTQRMNLLINWIEFNMAKIWVIYYYVKLLCGAFIVFLDKLTENVSKRLCSVFSQVRCHICHNNCLFSQYSAL